MAYDYESIIRAQAEQLAADRARALADLEASRLAEDSDGTMDAAGRVVDCDQRYAALDRIAGNYAAAQQQRPAANQFGLSRDEQDVAKISGITQEQYARNRQKMHQMKAQGYWSQGKVFK